MTTVEQSPQCKFLGHAYHDFAGAILWDMAGMILFALFVGIAKLIADHNPKWKTVSMVLEVEEVRKGTCRRQPAIE